VAKNLTRFDSLRSKVDVFQAIKMAMMHRGRVRQKPKPSEVKKTTDKLELVDVAGESHELLFKTNTVFPFTLFPDTVTLDREKLSFATRFFFSVAQVTSVPIRDILSVEVDVGPFFGSVRTASRYFVTNPKSVRFLWRGDAIKLQRLLQGYIIAHERKIDCSKIDKNELIKLLTDLGGGHTG